MTDLRNWHCVRKGGSRFDTPRMGLCPTGDRGDMPCHLCALIALNVQFACFGHKALQQTGSTSKDGLVTKLLKNTTKDIFRAFGYKIVALSREDTKAPVEFTARDVEILQYVLSNGLTMVSRQRLFATIQACKYVVANRIEGDFLECGVWRGGNALAAKMVFEAYDSDKQVHLFDTFAGMTEPTDHDTTSRSNIDANQSFAKFHSRGRSGWCYASLDDVRSNFMAAGVDLNGVSFVQGDVMETLLDTPRLPDRIAVLRLDTDWYESTQKEMAVLYPRLVPGGVLITDDYGHWDGARKAIDQFFEENPEYDRPLLQYTDYSGRMGIKY